MIKLVIKKTNYMKTSIITSLFIVLQVLLLGCNEEEASFSPQAKNQAQTDQNEIEILVNAFPVESLSQDELTSLTFMREEEKLAHDVYFTFYNTWRLHIFNNISVSEKTHTQAVLYLLEKYGLPDPVGNNGIGVFQNQDLQTLYNQLISQGSQSILEALIVGATIEDMDIVDLGDALQYIDNQDIIYVYNNLTKGSRNHLRSFYSQLIKQGYFYEAQFIEQSELEEIVNSPKETGNF